jgi:hypothetical protein
MQKMPQFHLIRLTASIDTMWQWETRTDVWIIGDVDGYRLFQARLIEAIDAQTNIHLDFIESCKTSMQCVILPAAVRPKTRPKLKLIERKAFKHDEPEMELIIYGNQAGYKILAAEFDVAILHMVDLPDHHIHIEDWWTSWVVKRSVSMNIRGPFSEWHPDRLQGHKHLVYERQDTYLPDNCDYMVKEHWPYEEPVAGESPYILR